MTIIKAHAWLALLFYAHFQNVLKNILKYCWQIKHYGTLKEGEPLPTIRGLAKDLRISVITTSRAYSDLERDGYIYSVVGKGSFVAERNREFIRERNLQEMEEYLTKAIEISNRCGMSQEQLIDLVKTIFEGQ